MDADQEQWYRRRWWALVFLGVSLLVVSLDTTVVNWRCPPSPGTSARPQRAPVVVDAYIWSSPPRC